MLIKKHSEIVKFENDCFSAVVDFDKDNKGIDITLKDKQTGRITCFTDLKTNELYDLANLFGSINKTNLKG